MADFSWVPADLEGRFSYVNGRLVVSCEKCGATRQTSGKGAVLKEIAAGKKEKFKLCGLHGNYKGFKPTKEDIASWPEGHKRCGTCKEIKPFSDFGKHRTAKFGYDTTCKACRVPLSSKAYSNRSFEQTLLDGAKSRARAQGKEFNITLDDIRIPRDCPILGVPIILERNHPHAPSLDRIDSSRGYVVGNVQVVSKKGNTYKNDMTLHEAERLLEYFKRMDGALLGKTVVRSSLA